MSRRQTRAPLRWAVIALLMATIGGAATAGASPAVAAAAGQQYVALGDSYAAGLGLSPAAANSPASGCGQSADDYPHQLATALDLTLTDVTCSGAVTADLAGGQRVSGTTIAPQFDALTSDTALVSLTIGGNDLGFGTIGAYCASLSGPSGPVLGGGGQQATCHEHFDPGGSDSVAQRLADTVVPALEQAMATIRSRSPQAKIVVVDYPAIAPDADHTPSGGCWTDPLSGGNGLPFTDADLPYLQQTQARLNQALADVATRAGAGVAQVYPASLAHTACSSDPWLNGVRLSGTTVASNSLHPNTAGAAQMAMDATAVARTLLAGGTAAAPVTVATGSGNGVPTWVWIVVAVGVVFVGLVAFGVLRVRRRLAPR